MHQRWRCLRASCALAAGVIAPGCHAIPVALLSTFGGVAAQALHLDAALAEAWTAKHTEAKPPEQPPSEAIPK